MKYYCRQVEPHLQQSRIFVNRFGRTRTDETLFNNSIMLMPQRDRHPFMSDFLKYSHDTLEPLLEEIDAAVAYVKGREDSKPYHDLSARRIVDAGIALVFAALFVMLSEKGVPGKEAALWFWLNVEFPRVRAGLEVVKGGYAAQVAEFEALAPAVPEEA